ALIMREEGFRARPYYCSEGFPTIGYGRVLGAKGTPLPNLRVTPEAEHGFVLAEVNRLAQALAGKWPWFVTCHPARQAVLISMAYQLGLAGVCRFKRMLAAIAVQDFELAAKEMLNSQWAKQTPARAQRAAKVMRQGA
ncbi:MAG: glycoside hydrolase family protein, partial [Aeromonas sp.]